MISLIFTEGTSGFYWEGKKAMASEMITFDKYTYANLLYKRHYSLIFEHVH